MKTMHATKLTRSQRKLLILAGVVAGYFLISLFFLLIPFQSKVHALRFQVKTFFEESEKAQEMMLAVNRSGQKYETTLDKLEHYRDMAPTPSVVAGVLDRAASSAERYHLTLVSMQPKNEEKVETPDKKPFIDEGREARLLKVEAAYNGSFFALGNYLIALENAPYKVIVREVDIRNPHVDTASSGSSDLDIRMDLGVLTMRPPQ